MLNKKNKFGKYSIFIILSLLIFNSCGYFADDPVESDEITSEQLALSCKLDPDSFKEILLTDIEGQISCLKENFVQFTKYVRTRRPDVIDRSEISQFVDQFFPENADNIKKSLKIIFELNMILFRDHHERIEEHHVDPLFSLLTQINKKSVIVSRILRSASEDRRPEDFHALRSELSAAIHDFSSIAVSIMSIENGTPQVLNIKDFILHILRQNEALPKYEEAIDTLLFIKRLIVGGDKRHINTDELIQLLLKVPNIIVATFDIAYATQDSFQTNVDFFNFYQKDVKAISESFHQLDDSEHIFNIAALFDIFKPKEALPARMKRFLFKVFFTNVMKNEFKDKKGKLSLPKLSMKDFEIIANEIKEHLIGGDPKNVSFKELKIIFSMLDAAIETAKYGATFTEQAQEIDRLNREIQSDSEEKSGLPLEELLRRKEKITIAAYDAKNHINDLYNDKTNFPANFAPLAFLRGINEKVDAFNFDLELFSTLFSAKKILAGGTREDTTREQFFTLINKLPQVTEVVFNMGYLSPAIFREKEGVNLAIFLRSNLDLLKQQLYPLKKNELIFTFTELLSAINKFVSFPELETFRPSVMAFRDRILRQTPAPQIDKTDDSFLSSDLNSLLQIFDTGIDRYLFSDIAYRLHENILISPKKLKNFVLIDHPELENFPQELKDEYVKIVRSYRYFRDAESGLQYYTIDIHRTDEGLKETFLFKWLMEKFGEAYGVIDPVTGRYVIDLEALEKNMLGDYMPILEYLKLSSPNSNEVFARNIILLGDLFQNKSNGNMSLNSDEATEFVSLILTSEKLTKQIMDKFAEPGGPCEPVNEEGEDFAIDGPCYRKHFFEILFDQLRLGQYFSRLSLYINSSTPEEIRSFLVSVEEFARDDARDHVPMLKRDFTLLIGALLNIESTFIRFDYNLDNLIDQHEVGDAFVLYRNAIRAILTERDTDPELARSVFYYMIKYQEMPTAWELVKFHLQYFKLPSWAYSKKIRAKRINVGSLLSYLVKDAKKKANDKKDKMKLEKLKIN